MKELSAVDQKLVKLLEEHILLARKADQEDRSFVVQDELKTLASEIHNGPLSAAVLRAILNELQSAARNLNQLVHIAYLGPEGTFTQQAACRHFGSAAHFQAEDSIENVYEAVENGPCSYGVVPVENSTQGSVAVTLDSSTRSPLRVCGEACLPIAHMLLSQTNKLSDVDHVYSHPQALAQCRKWLLTHLPNAVLQAVESTGAGAQQALKNEKSAAIGSEMLANAYDLPILAEKIQDRDHNFTRFWILGTESCSPSGADKTSIWFVAPHQPGSLHRSLQVFGDAGVNITRIESRPSVDGAWKYIFFLDLDGHRDEAPLGPALKELARHVEHLRVLGSYPRAKQTH